MMTKLEQCIEALEGESDKHIGCRSSDYFITREDAIAIVIKYFGEQPMNKSDSEE